MLTLLHALASALLLLVPILIEARPWYYAVLLRLLPFFVGIFLSFFTFAQFMGWPV
jgi:hypothetical protein